MFAQEKLLWILEAVKLRDHKGQFKGHKYSHHHRTCYILLVLSGSVLQYCKWLRRDSVVTDHLQFYQ